MAKTTKDHVGPRGPVMVTTATSTEVAQMAATCYAAVLSRSDVPIGDVHWMEDRQVSWVAHAVQLARALVAEAERTAPADAGPSPGPWKEGA